MTRSRTVPFALAFAALVTAPTVGHAQEDAGKATLALRLAEGEEVRLRWLSRTEQLADVGLISMVNDAAIGKDITITGRGSSDEGIVVTWRIDRVWGEMINPLMDVQFDSSKPPEEPDPMTALFSAHGGTEYTVTLGPDGSVKKVEGVADAIEKAAAAYGDEASMYQMLFGRLISEEKIATEIEWFLLVGPTPADAVTVGTSWEDSDLVPGTAESVSFTVGGTRLVESIDADAVVIGGDATLSVTKGPGRENAMSRVLEDDVEKREEASLSMRLSRKDGLPLASESDFYFAAFFQKDDGEDGSLRQRSRFTLRRIPADAPAGDAELSDLKILDDRAEGSRAGYALWLLGRGRMHEKAESPDDARLEYRIAASMATAATEAGWTDADWTSIRLRALKAMGVSILN